MSNNRQNIIEATQRLLQTHGLARLTTRDIAREAGVAEGLIYHHFKDKAELIHEVVHERMSTARNVLLNLPLKVGMQTLSENLEEVMQVMYDSHYEAALMVCSIFSDHQLRTRMREILRERNIGPKSAIEGLDVYLTAEQRLGRLSEKINPSVAAKCLWMLCVQMGMFDQMAGQKPDRGRARQEIRQYVHTLMNGLAPCPASEEKSPVRSGKRK